ncbi:MAG TPA: carbamoyltransferase C-terminal domain-containing protein [archaeon]|nr:carbamoyltransferase C-terminal domain-containing protein [archaeon]
MYVLGVNPGVYRTNHDSSACLIRDGKIVAFVSQERFDRIKHSHAFPNDAINWCLKYAGIKDNEVDIVAMNWDPKLFISSTFSFPSYAFNLHNTFNRFLNMKLYQTTASSFRILENRFGKKVKPIRHHLAHAASSYYVSGLKKSLILTMDGRGESDATVGWIGSDGNKIERLFGYDFFKNHSFGLCYTRMTKILGLGRFSEGKTMGLAPWGKPTFDFSDIISFNNGNILADYSKIARFEKYSRNKDEPLQDVHKNLAASLQKALQETILKLVEKMRDDAGIKNICLAGGTSLNCTTNGLIATSGLFDSVYLQPAASDDGAAMGAAMHAYVQAGGRPSTIMNHAYFGPEFTNEEIEKAIKESGEKYEYHEDITGVVSELLHKDKIVGWFQGRMEVGPRALGNRTILGNPTVAANTDRVNEVKSREKWRPLAPSILHGHEEKYFENGKLSPFMIMAFVVKPEKRSEIPAVTHVDGTARPQSVLKETNPKYFELISKFQKLSGVPIVLNTSYNDKSEPIVCTPQDAIRTFKITKMGYTAIGNFLLKK